MAGYVRLPVKTHRRIRYYEGAPSSEAAGTQFLLLHGLGNSVNFWTAVAPRLAETRRTLAVDLPGFGRSARPAAGFTLENMAADILAFCRDLETRDCVIVGHSLGSFVALQLAALAPDVFQRIVLIDGTLVRANRVTREIRYAARHPGLTFAVAAQFAGGVVPMSRLVARILGSSRVIRSLALWPFVARPGRLDGALLTAALADNGGLSVLRALIRSRGVDYTTLLQRVTQPVDLCWGASDRLIDGEDVRVVQLNATVGRQLKIDRCGHWPMLEKPPTVVEFLLQGAGLGTSSAQHPGL